MALRYLPEDYINGTINEVIKDATKKKIYEIFKLDIAKQFAKVAEFFSPITHGAEIANKVFMPRIEQFTSSIWHIIGLATYHQVKEESKELNQKVTEMADILTATFQNTEKFCQKLGSMATQLNLISWEHTSSRLQTAVETIDTMAHQHQHFKKDSLNSLQKTESEKAPLESLYENF